MKIRVDFVYLGLTKKWLRSLIRICRLEFIRIAKNMLNCEVNIN